MIILGLGTNIGNRLQNLRTAINKLRQISQLTILNISPIYESDAMVPTDCQNASWHQPYLNLAIACQTLLKPNELLQKTKQIECDMGRPPKHPHWGPRLIDIDILAWNDLCIYSDKLHIPHKEICLRPFAMWPLADLSPNWVYSDQNGSRDFLGLTAAQIVEPWGSRFSGNAPFSTKQIMTRVDFPQIVGILNVTPNSFSDGGKFANVDSALKQAKHLFASGAEIIDIGAESTNPNIKGTLTTQKEWQRLKTILKELLQLWPDKNTGPQISIDTRNYEVAAKCIDLGVDWINDVTGFDDQNMISVVKNAAVKLLVMHSLSCPPQKNLVLPNKQDPIKILINWMQQKIAQFAKAEINQERIIFDPGIGFGKTAEQNLEIIRRVNTLKQDIALPILVGHSRKSFFSSLTDVKAQNRDLETIIVSNYLATQRVDYLRVHDVMAHARSFKIMASLNIL